MFLSILSISRTSVSDCSDEVLTLKKLAFNLFTVTILYNKLSLYYITLLNYSPTHTEPQFL